MNVVCLYCTNPLLALTGFEDENLATNPGGGGSGGGAGLVTTEGTWAQTCSKCGSGMNLRLTGAVRCLCQQDSVKIDYSGERMRRITSGKRRATSARSKGNVTDSLSITSLSTNDSTPTMQIRRISNDVPSYGRSNTVSYTLPRPNPSPKQHVTVYRNLNSSADSRMSDRIVLKYNDAIITQPNVQHMHVSSTLPKLVTKYIGKRHNLKDPLPAHLDTSRHTLSLSIVSNTFYG